MDCLWGKNPERLAQGQQPYPLAAHLLDTVCTAEALWDHWLTPRLQSLIASDLGVESPTAKSIVSLAAGLHDLGKANPIFQMQAADERALRWKKPHQDALASLGLGVAPPALVNAYRSDFKNPMRRHEVFSMGATTADMSAIVTPSKGLLNGWFSAVLGGHHGKWHTLSADHLSDFQTIQAAPWRTTQDDIVSAVCNAVGITLDEIPTPSRQNVGRTIALVSGLVMIADWLASDDALVDVGQALFDGGLSPTDAAPEWLHARRAEIADHVLTTLGTYRAPADPLEEILGKYKDSPRPLQKEAIETADRPGLWLVAYPTGEGKTETALLRHVGQDEGIIFGLPTRATTDAMHGRLAAMLTDNQVVLSHQFASVKNCCSGDGSDSDWFTTGLRRLIAPVSAATCDQVLMGALNQKHSAMRLVALANHHIVLDEVHTYDHYQTALLKELLIWWGSTGTRVTLLSATMPMWQQREFESAYREGLRSEPFETPSGATYPSCRFISDEGEQDAVHGSLAAAVDNLNTNLIESSNTTAAHVDWTRTARTNHPNTHIAVVVNTVERCLGTADAITRALPGHDVICLHSRMTQEHRSDLEAQLIARLGPNAAAGAPVIVVATSVIEASLDIDFDLMCTDLSPAASLIQRAGRLWRFRDPVKRNARVGTPIPRTLNVVVPAAAGKPIDRNNAMPFASTALERVRAHLNTNPVVRVPQDVQAFVDETAFDLAEFQMSESVDQEFIDANKRLFSADRSASDMGALISRPKYSTLVKMTECSDHEEAMMTRYIDRVSGTYILIDPSRNHPHALGTSLKSLMTAPAKSAVQALAFAVPTSGKVGNAMAALHAETLRAAGIAAWDPSVRILGGLFPVDVGLMESSAGLSYGELGLRQNVSAE